MENGDAPATKQDVSMLRTELHQSVAMLRTEMQHMHDDFIERLDKSETRLLNAFYTYAESNQKRVAAIETESAGLKSRLSTIEDRLTGVEKRLNMPPQQ